MKLDIKKMNCLTWYFEVIKEQYNIVKYDINNLLNMKCYNNKKISWSIKQIQLSNQLFNVGLSNYSKVIKSGFINFEMLNKIFNLYIKRAILNIKAAKCELIGCVNLQIYKTTIFEFLQKIRKLLYLYNELEKAYFKLVNSKIY